MCLACIGCFVSFTFWPVFLLQLGAVWELSNTEIGWISGAYFIGYVVATPVLVGLTDRIDSRFIFLGGCGFCLAGGFGFMLFAGGLWSAMFCWALVGVGHAGNYMPGLQILNIRLDSHHRVRAIPWYTACLGIGIGVSFAMMGYILQIANYKIALWLCVVSATLSALLVFAFVPPRIPEVDPDATVKRHPLDLSPAFRKPLALGYILAYGAHTYELFAFRSWSFALMVFLGLQAENPPDISELSLIISMITLTSWVTSIIGAQLAIRFGRHRVISLVGGLGCTLALISALSLAKPFYLIVGILWLYSLVIMLDSSALTTGTVEAGASHDRGALLAIHSMVGFGAGALGGPVIGYILDLSGGVLDGMAWMYVLLAMGVGSLLVMLIQMVFWRRSLKMPGA